jgi:hypothetical protein
VGGRQEEACGGCEHRARSSRSIAGPSPTGRPRAAAASASASSAACSASTCQASSGGGGGGRLGPGRPRGRAVPAGPSGAWQPARPSPPPPPGCRLRRRPLGPGARAAGGRGRLELAAGRRQADLARPLPADHQPVGPSGRFLCAAGVSGWISESTSLDGGCRERRLGVCLQTGVHLPHLFTAPFRALRVSVTWGRPQPLAPGQPGALVGTPPPTDARPGRAWGHLQASYSHAQMMHSREPAASASWASTKSAPFLTGAGSIPVSVDAPAGRPTQGTLTADKDSNRLNRAPGKVHEIPGVARGVSRFFYN